MSPKQITRLALTLAGISIVGMVLMLALHPDWGVMTWWPAMGLGLSVLLLVAAYLRGAYLSVRRRVALVDKLNDCYTGVTETGDPAT